MPRMQPLTDDEILEVAGKHCEFTPEGTYHLRRYPGKWAIVQVVRECFERSQSSTATNGVQRGDGAERRVEAFIEKRHAEIRSCSLGCGEYGQCKANMHGVPSECPARGSAGNAGVVRSAGETFSGQPLMPGKE